MTLLMNMIHKLIFSLNFYKAILTFNIKFKRKELNIIINDIENSSLGLFDYKSRNIFLCKNNIYQTTLEQYKNYNDSLSSISFSLTLFTLLHEYGHFLDYSNRKEFIQDLFSASGLYLLSYLGELKKQNNHLNLNSLTEDDKFMDIIKKSKTGFIRTETFAENKAIELFDELRFSKKIDICKNSIYQNEHKMELMFLFIKLPNIISIAFPNSPENETKTFINNIQIKLFKESPILNLK